MSIETNFEIPLVASLALREKQIQQNYRPIIAVHKWFARRPGTLFRALMLAEFGEGPLRERYFESNQLRGIRVGDPFMGGGTPLFEANRLGCDVVGFDINPMAYWIVRQEIEWLDISAYRAAAAQLQVELERAIGAYYQTECLKCHREAPVKYFLWVKSQSCDTCGAAIDLFPGYVVAENRRHPRHVLVCGTCGELNEVEDRQRPRRCACGSNLNTEGPARRGKCACPTCGAVNRFPTPERGPPQHKMFALEYHCRYCKGGHVGRFFKRPSTEDLARYADARKSFESLNAQFIPTDAIPRGDETNRLHRWGYERYCEMFNERQLLGLESLARLVSACPNVRVRNALATNLSDLLRYQNMLCRYDSTALKSLDIFSVHGFPVGLIQCESNLLGISTPSQSDLFGGNGRSGVNVGSGGWSNIVDKYARAKSFCARPFEVFFKGRRKSLVYTSNEWIGDARPEDSASHRREVTLNCGSATFAELAPASLDAVFTDPPYFSNVQYAELMDFCFVWLRRLLQASEPAFAASTTRNSQELTGNETLERGFEHFAEGLSQVFCRMGRALKPGRPFVFTYHNNDLAAYYPIAVGILDAGLSCTAAIPCPAEMAASIHISGTGSSVVDTVFVCRAVHGGTPFPREESPASLAEQVRQDCEQLRAGGVLPTLGDVRCIAYGHLVRVAISCLGSKWDRSAQTAARLKAVADWIENFGGYGGIEPLLNDLSENRAQAEKTPSLIRGAADAKIPV